MKFVIYGLFDPRTGEIRYIGKSSSGLRRPERHRHPSELAKDNSHKARWIRVLHKDGLTYGIIVLEKTNRELLNTDETKWIALARSNQWPLTNLTDGGEGVGRVFSEDTRKKISLAAKGRRKSESHRAALAEAQRGRKLSAEVRAKMSEVAKARIAANPEERARLATLRTGMKNSPEAREKLRLANLGLVHSPERCAKNSAARIGKKLSLETRAKMSASRRRRSASSIISTFG